MIKSNASNQWLKSWLQNGKQGENKDLGEANAKMAQDAQQTSS